MESANPASCLAKKNSGLLRVKEGLREGVEVLELLESGLLGEDLLVDKAAEANHGEAGVLELSELETADSRVVTTEVEGVKAEVARGAALSEHVAGRDLAAVREHLDAAEGEEDLPEAGGGDGEEGVEGELGVKAGKGKVDALLHPEAEAAEHADAAVLELSLAEPLKVEIVGEAKGVEADITGHGAVEGGGAREERHGLRPVKLHLGACQKHIRNENISCSRVDYMSNIRATQLASVSVLMPRPTALFLVCCKAPVHITPKTVPALNQL